MSNAAQHTRMIPYPVIEAAVHGETDAVNEVIRHYSNGIVRFRLHQLRFAEGQAVTRTATTALMLMKNCVEGWKRN